MFEALFEQHLSRAEHIEAGPIVLRFFGPSDAADVTAMAGDPLVAETTAHIPHPYALSDAQAWIGSHQGQKEACSGLHWAIVEARSQVLVGAMSLDITRRDKTAHLGYWVGRKFWGRGFASAAAGATVTWTMGCGLEKLSARCLASNIASVKVLERCGFVQEGLLRRQVLRQGK